MSKTITETTQENNSVTLKKDSKGNFTYEIKVYGNDREAILNEIKAINEILEKSYTKEVEK